MGEGMCCVLALWQMRISARALHGVSMTAVAACKQHHRESLIHTSKCQACSGRYHSRVGRHPVGTCQVTLEVSASCCGYLQGNLAGTL